MTKTDMHIHSKYSWDSKMEIEDIVQTLIKNQIQYAALTDHIEFDREPLLYVMMKLKIRNLEIDRINEKYKGKVKLLKAVEISEPHLYKEKIKNLDTLDLDFIMGSIHHIDKKATTNVERELATLEYYKEVLKMVETNQIDVIGHLDYINKYYGKDYSGYNQVDEVLCAIKEHNQIIEINTSAERRAGLNLFPSIDKICRYRITGGSYVTIGTDAHQVEEIADNLEQAEYLSEQIGLEPVIFQKRKIERI